MEGSPRPEDFRLLGVGPGCTREELARGYERAKALYSEGSLATYSLLDTDEREGMRTRIEEAYLRIHRALDGGAPAPVVEKPAPPRPDPRPVCPEPDPASPSPGLPVAPSPSLDFSSPLGPQLRRIREAKGKTLREISTVTRIRSTHLESIEEERFDQLPAAVYLRGFLLDYARQLCLPQPEALAAAYLARVPQKG